MGIATGMPDDMRINLCADGLYGIHDSSHYSAKYFIDGRERGYGIHASEADRAADYLWVASQPTATYRFYDLDSNLLYVGITYLMRTRAEQHKRKSSWYRHALMLEINWYHNRLIAIAVERSAILHERPAFNTARSDTPARYVLPDSARLNYPADPLAIDVSVLPWR